MDSVNYMLRVVAKIRMDVCAMVFTMGACSSVTRVSGTLSSQALMQSLHSTALRVLTALIQ